MSDAKEILHQILNDEKLLNSRAFRDKVYTDEPIIRTASQIPRPRTPEKIKEMKGLAFTPEAYWKTSAWLFYTQGKFMEDFEDVYDFKEDFVKYFPSYRDMTIEQLRGYFSWRTKVRKGNIEKAPAPFVYIYLYELINCIGYTAPADCFKMFRSFCTEYSAIDESIKKYTDTWLRDFIVYYDLDSSLADDLDDIRYDKQLLTLIHWDEHSDEELFNAIDALSAYQLKKSLFYAACPDDMKEITVRCFRKLSEFFRDKRKNSLCGKLFGNIVECSYNMFASSIFYDRQSLRDCEYALNEIHSFTCKSGKWKCSKYYGNRSRNSRLGDLVKAIDSLMRDKNDFKHKISYTGVSKTAVKTIQAEIDCLYEEKRRAEASRIEIDLSKLAGIRKAADSTREKLLVDEEEPAIVTSVPGPAAIEKKEVTTNTAESPLDDEETLFIKALLYGRDAGAAAQSCGKMVSILADSVNEKLFDIFGDTVIDFSADSPELIEDYTDELREMFPDNKE